MLLKKKKLSLKYTLLWILSGLVMLVVAIFPQLLITVTQIMGIIDYRNGLYSIAIFFVLIILMSITGIVSKLNEKNKTLIQQVALMEKRIRDLEEHHSKNEYAVRSRND
jgi:hypothetical protein